MNHRILVSTLLIAASTSCGKKEAAPPPPENAQAHVESATDWTSRTELFLEYPPLVAGEASRFAIHLTRLDNFRPLASGQVEVHLVAGGKTEVFAADTPSRPGIFGASVKPSFASEYRMSIHVNSAGLIDTHDLGVVKVAATKEKSAHEHPPETEEKIAFLKEQQWALDFGTAVIESRQLKSSLRVPATVTPRSGGEAEASAPLDGRLVAESAFPIVGAQVVAGQILAAVLPPTASPADLSGIELGIAQAQAELSLAHKDRERAERLVAAGAAAAKRVDEASTIETTTAARLKAAQSRLDQYRTSSAGEGTGTGAKLFAVRAPISGVITESHASAGANVKAGDKLFRIVDADTVYVSAIVPEAELPQMKHLSGAELEIPGTEHPRHLAKLVSMGRVVDASSRTFPVVYEISNRDHAVAVNQAVNVRLLTSAVNSAPAIPESAIIDDAGRPIVFLQRAGESFVRRPVTLGVREGGLVQVLEGVKAGERVVTKGAHLIRLSTMSSQVPAHGHVH